MVISVYAEGGFVPGMSERRAAYHLLMLRNGHPLWGQNMDAGRQLNPEFPGPFPSSLNRSPGRRSEHHQRRTRCSFLNLSNSHNARLGGSSLSPLCCPVALWENLIQNFKRISI